MSCILPASFLAFPGLLEPLSPAEKVRYRKAKRFVKGSSRHNPVKKPFPRALAIWKHQTIWVRPNGQPKIHSGDIPAAFSIGNSCKSGNQTRIPGSLPVFLQIVCKHAHQISQITSKTPAAAYFI